MKCTPSAIARKVPFPMLASKTRAQPAAEPAWGCSGGVGGAGGKCPFPSGEGVGGLRLLASQLLLLCPWFKGLASAFFSWLLIPSDVVQSAPVLWSKGHCCSVITRSPVSSRHVPVPPLNIAVLESASKSWSAGSSSDGPEMYSTMGGS